MVARYRGPGLGGFTWGRPRCNKAFGTVVDEAGNLAVQGWCNDVSTNALGTGAGWLTQTALLSGGELTQYKDGILVGTETNVFDTKGGQMVLGANLSGALHVDMDVAGVLVYDRALSAAERQSVETYLQDKYLAGDPGENTAPATSGDVASTAPGGSVTIDVLANDTDAQGNLDPTSVTVTTAPTHGTANVDASGSVTYTHDGSSSDSDSFAYTVSDLQGATSAPAVVTISVGAVPVVGDPVVELESDSGLTVSNGVVSGWDDASGRGNDLVAVGAPGVTSTPTGATAVTFDGVDDLLYREGGLSGVPAGGADRTVFMVARYRSAGMGGFSWGRTRCNKAFGTVVDTAGGLAVQGWCNDISAGVPGTGAGWLTQSAVLSANELRQYRNGALVATATHTYDTKGGKMVLGAELDLAPHVDMDVAGVLVYDRALSSSERQTVEAYLQLKYLTGEPGTNTAPTAGDDVATTIAGGSVTVDVLANDSDAQGNLNPGTVTVSGAPTSGTAVVNSNGTVTYTHDGSATTSDSFTYTVADDAGATSLPAIVTVSIGETPAEGHLVLSLESDAGVSATGGVVSGWNDSSGRGNDLAAGGTPGVTSTPTGLPAVSFDGVDDVLQRGAGLTAMPSGNADRSVFLVTRYRSVGMGGFSWGNASCNRLFGTTVDTAGRLAVQGWCNGNDFSTSVAGSGTGWLVQTAVLSAGELRQYKDGALAQIVAHTFNTSSGSIVLGAEHDLNPHLAMDVAGVLVYDQALGNTQRQAVEDYLRSKYVAAGPGQNTPPVTAGDVASTTPGGSVTVNVLANDTDAQGNLDPSTVTVSSGPAHGTTTVNVTGTITYTHDGSVGTNDSFAYTVSDVEGATSAPSTVTITIGAGGEPSDFNLEPVLEGLNQPIGFAALPDGRLLVLEKVGRIVIADPSQTPVQYETYLQIEDLAAERERGLIDIALDPNFESNGHFYVYYSKASIRTFRISRFTHTENVGGTSSRASYGSEFIVWQNPNKWTNCCHFGGGLDVGPDGKIYLTTGEEFIAEQALDMTIADGKIIRVGRDGSIPADNPFVDGPGGNLDEIWAFGLRNPFRADWDLPTERFFIGEVGGNDNATAWEDIHLGRKGANFGWPACEGMCADPAYDDPVFTYPHSGKGASVTGGVVYRGSRFPEAFDGAYFYADYVRGFLRYLTFDPDGNVTGDFPFADELGSVVAIEEGQDGALYLADIAAGTVVRFVYGDGNRVPRITSTTAGPTIGEPPLTVDFAAAAVDDDDDPLTYTWVFGDGTTANAQTVQHVYQEAGVYQAVLRVSDGKSTTSSDSISITVGNPQPPVAQITGPPDGMSFRANDVIEFAGTATDPDETLDGSHFSWTVKFMHNEHSHPVLGPEPGTGGSFEIPDNGHDYASETRYLIELTVTDSTGLADTESVIVWPEKVALSLDTTVPGGHSVLVDSIGRQVPSSLDALVGFRHQLSAPLTTCNANVLYEFVSWSNGAPRQHELVVPDSDLTLTTTYDATETC